MAKSVKVHDDTHHALKRLKVQRRSKSVDEVIRDMIRQSTGHPVERAGKREAAELTTFLAE